MSMANRPPHHQPRSAPMRQHRHSCFWVVQFVMCAAPPFSPPARPRGEGAL